jgi:hypothetical protein
VLSHFFITILLSHSLLIQCSVIPRCYSVQLFFIATALNHSLYYSTQPFSIATVLSHFHCKRSSIIPRATVLNHSSLLQCSIIPRHYSVHAARSFCKMTEQERGCAGQDAAWSGRCVEGRRLTTRLRVRRGERLSTRGWARGCMIWCWLARSVGWTIRFRWWTPDLLHYVMNSTTLSYHCWFLTSSFGPFGSNPPPCSFPHRSLTRSQRWVWLKMFQQNKDVGLFGLCSVLPFVQNKRVREWAKA